MNDRLQGRRRLWLFVAAAAAIFLLVGLAVGRFSEQQAETARATAQRNTLASDVNTLCEQVKSLGRECAAPPSEQTLKAVQGNQGVRGPVGPAGEPGRDGPPGPVGVKGAAGTAGVKGAAGSAGVPGPGGTDGKSGVDGKAGPPGAAGGGGADGPPGPAGVAGPAGATGPTGNQGPAGPEPASFTFTMAGVTYLCADPEKDGTYACKAQAAGP